MIRNHVEQRRIDRINDPDRFNIKPSVAERAVRRPPPQSTAYDDSADMKVRLPNNKPEPQFLLN